MTRGKRLIFLLIILATAIFFRLWQLDSIPPGLYPDVAINGNDALDSLKSGNFKVFYPDNNGREGLFIWLIALSFSIFGVSIWSIKIVAATIGILTVLGLYLLTKELFKPLRITNLNELRIDNPESIALLSSFFLAISFWHVNFSRIGFRAILLPFILVFSFYFLFRGFRILKTSENRRTFYGSVLNFSLAAVIFGVGFYTYISFRLAIILLAIVLFLWWLIYRKQVLQKKFIIHASCFLILIFIVVLPIGIYFLENPQDFIGRATPVSVFAAENPIKEFGKSLIFHLGMFNFSGDPNWRHNFAGSPMLFWPVGIFFLIGLFYSFYKLVKSIVLRSTRLFVVFGFLIAWWLIMLLPGILTYEGIPHALRTIGVIPVVYIFAGFGGWSIYKWFEQNMRSKKLLILTSILFLLMIGVFQFNKYFINWGKLPEVAEAFTKDYFEIGNYLNSLPADYQKYVIVNEFGVPLYGISIPAQTPMFIERSKFGQLHSVYLTTEDLDKIKIENKKTVIIPLYDGRLLKELQKNFPQGEIQERDKFLIYKINF